MLFSKEKNDNKTIPRSAFNDQVLHGDFQPEIANANARLRGKPVPYSIIINSYHEDASILACCLSSLEVIGMERFTLKSVYEGFSDPIKIPIPTGCMVAFGGGVIILVCSWAYILSMTGMRLSLPV